ncbi:hypothetical protein FACS189415_2930 [Bacteroidia bacterium]|nr:hypothetical protein FACS189426_16700 [Bacteroidia bacterium]GHT29206.1 hypothetical protein FACS189432_08190 [Bacteroidia bacterium]GHU82459.1 hypothetical protein FACS189415_2930 [Bacteroidia bacterium]
MSLRESKKDYKFEFWSEIIASKIGKLLGFNVVDYNIAYNRTEIGCMSQSIINNENEDLSEGYGFIVEKYPDFQVNFKKTHSFQKIIGALKNIHLEHCQRSVLEMVVFDTIIGNTDRHSENWGIVITNRLLDDILKKLSRWKKIRFKINIFLITKGQMSFQKLIKRYKEENWKFSPLYDNGSSLGRELSEDKIINLLNNEDEFDKFINRGKPDIRWNDKNLNHFELIDVLLLDYQDEMKPIFENVRKRYNKNSIETFINNIDNKIPIKFNEYKLSDNRKKFIIKNIDKRINFLINKSNE